MSGARRLLVPLLPGLGVLRVHTRRFLRLFPGWASRAGGQTGAECAEVVRGK